MGVNLSGRNFLRLLDFSTEEIEYLLKLSKNFKDMKRAGVPHRYLEARTSFCCSRRLPPVPVALSKSAQWTSAWA